MNAIQKISKRAKALQKQHPNAQWKNLIKQASREYNTGKLPQTRKKKSKGKKVGGMNRPRIKRRVDHDVAVRATGAGLTIAAATHFIKQELKEKLGKEMVRQHIATTKAEKRRIGKTIKEIKNKLRKLD